MKTKLKYGLCAVLAFFAALCMCMCALSYTSYAAVETKVTVKSVTDKIGTTPLSTSSQTLGDETFTAYGSSDNTFGGFAQLLTLDKSYDISAINSTGKGAFTFYFYIGSEQCLNAYQNLSKKTSKYFWNIDVCCTSTWVDGTDGSDAHKIMFDIHEVFTACELGWNKVVLPFSTVSENKNMDFSKIGCIRLNTAGAELGAGDSNFWIGNLAFTVTDQTEMSATPIVLDFVKFNVKDSADFVKETVTLDGNSTTAYAINDAWGEFVRLLTLDGAHSAKALFDSGKGALQFYMYFTDSSLKAYQDLKSKCIIDICSADSYNDTDKYNYTLWEIFNNCNVGWNKIVLPLETASEKKSINWDTIKFIRINFMYTGIINGGSQGLKFADFRIVKTDYTAKTAIASVDKVDIKSMSLSLAGDIGINFFVSIGIDNSIVSASAEDIKTVFTVAAVEGRVKETVEVALDTNNKNNSGYYQFTINLPAADMTRNITAQVYNGTKMLGDAKTVSVKDYAEKGIVEWTGTANAKYIPLMKAMLDYGAAAQKLFGIDEENLANSNFSAKVDTVDFANVPSGTLGENNDDSLKPLNTALVLESTTSIRVYFANGVDASGYTITVTDTENNTAKTAEIKLSEYGCYYFDISDIAASKLDCLYNVKITSGETSFEFTISAVNAAKAAQNSEKPNYSEEFALVGRTLYLYNQAANAVAA